MSVLLPAFFMDLESALNLLHEAVLALRGRSLSDVETSIVRGAYQGQTYGEIAETFGYSASYLSRDIGPKFWKMLTEALGEPVGKKNIRSVLDQRLRQTPIPPQAESPIDTPPGIRTDWGAAPDVSSFYGRDCDLSTLRQWVVTGSEPKGQTCRLIAVLGMGGIGKTWLISRFLEILKASEDCPFTHIIWRSLRHGPRFKDILADLVLFLSDQTDLEATIPRLLHWLRHSRCLFILDNFETVLQGVPQSGQHDGDPESYRDLLRLIGETNHQSCLIITSREKPRELSALEGMDLPVRSLSLSGSQEAAMALIQTKIQAKELIGSEQQQRSLCDLYGNNLLALQMVATSIQDLFEGEIAAFQAADTLSFSGIQQLLAEQFDRCTALEHTILYWLAINRAPTPIAELSQDIIPAVSPSALLEAIESLMWRSLVEKQSGCYIQQPVMTDYVTMQLVDQVCDNIMALSHGTTHPSKPFLLATHALLKTTGSDYIRDIQIREILQPVLVKLAGLWGTSANREMGLSQALASIRTLPTQRSSYAAGNLLNLLSQICPALNHYDFSGLTLRQADLRRVTLHNCNLQGSDLSQAVFLEPLSIPLALKFSPDSRLLAIGDATGVIRIWRVEDGRSVLTCSGHTDWIWSLSFSPDGRSVASGSSDRTVKLWDLETGQCLHTFVGHTAQVWSVSFHPAEPLLASAGEDRTIHLWNINTHTCRTLQGHTDWIRTVVFSPDGQTLASGSDDHTIKIWETVTGECRQTLEGHTMRVWDVAYAPRGILASSSSDRTIKLWNPDTGQCFRTLEGHQNWVRAIAISPDGELLASGSEDQSLKLWQVATGTCQQTLRAHRNWIRSVAFSPDGECFASGSGDNTVKLWRRDGQCRRTLQGYIDRVWSVALSPDSSALSGILASAHDDHHIKLWNLSDLSYRQTLSGHRNSVCAVAFDPTGSLLASGSEDHTIKLWTLETGQCRLTLNGHTGRIWSVAFSPDGEWLASASEDHTIKLWDVETGQCLRTLAGHENWVCCIAFHPGDRHLLASASYDQTLKLWNPQTGECLHTLTGHRNWVWSVAFSPDGNTLASGSGDQTIKHWSLHTQKCLNTLNGHSSRVWSVSFSPDGHILASASSDKTIKLWDLKTGHCLNTLEGHTNLAWTVAFSADGQRLASGSQDETIRVWQTQSGDCQGVLRGVRPYEKTNILGAKGLTDAQRLSLKQLGAWEAVESAKPSRTEDLVTAPSPISPEPSATVPLSEGSIIGRQTEWETIQQWLWDQQSPLLLVTGESGIGKTRLLKELGQAVIGRGGQVLWGRGFAAELSSPFGIWLDLLRTDPEAMTLPPDLSALLFTQESEGDTQINRTRLFNAFGDHLKALAQQQTPLLIILDDIQWIDEVSTALLHYAVRLLSSLPIKFACTARSQELEANVNTYQLVKMLRRDRHLQMLVLKPLDSVATARLAHSIHPDLDGEQIYIDSGGNPLFIMAMARAIAEGSPARSETIETLVQDRLQQLNPATQNLLNWAAAMGRSFNPKQITQVADCSLTDFLTAIEELERQAIVTPEQMGNGEMGYLFAHDVVRQVAYQQLSEPRRQLMHRHIAQCLQAIADPSLTSDIAHHALLGQEAHLAAQALLGSSEQGLQLSAYAYADDAAQQGIDQCQSLQPSQRIDLHLRLLKVRIRAGVNRDQSLQIEADVNRLVREARRLGLLDQEALGREVLITLNYEQDNLTEVHQHCVLAIERGRNASPIVTAQTLAYTGWCFSDIGREMEQAEALLLEAQALSDRVGLDLFDIPCGLGCVRRYHGDYEAARLLLTHARQIATELQDHWRQFLCLSYRVMLELEARDATAALTYAQEMKRTATHLSEGSEGTMATALESLSQYWLEQPGADMALTQSLEVLKREDNQRTLAYVLTSAAEKDLEVVETNLDQDRVAIVISRCEAALDAAQIVDLPSDMALARTSLIRGYLAQGNSQAAIVQWQALNQGVGVSGRAKSAIAAVNAQLKQALSRRYSAGHSLY